MARPKKEAKAFNKVVEESGVQVRVYEREKGGPIYREATLADGTRSRKSMGHRDPVLAEQQARDLARHLALLTLSGHTGAITLGRLFSLYLAHRGPHLAPARLKFMETTTGMLLRHFGPDYDLDRFGQHDADTYLKARRSGTLVPPDRRASDKPRDGTLRNELQAFSCICNWAIGFRPNGQRLLSLNPVRTITQPQEVNTARPRAGKERFNALFAVADQVDSTGQFRLMLALAWHTGRRINAICHLRRSDLLLTPAEVWRALAAAGHDEADTLAQEWPEAIRWAAEWDKKKYLTFSPMPAVVKQEVARYLRRNPCLGDAWVFPSSRDPEQAQSKLMAEYYLRKAEKLAGLPHLHRGGWHAFRRGWASARKHLPVQDVMQAGGWRDVKALQTAYQGADAKTTRQVVEFGT